MCNEKGVFFYAEFGIIVSICNLYILFGSLFNMLIGYYIVCWLQIKNCMPNIVVFDYFY